MSMPASVMEFTPIGHHEIRITRVYTVETGEFVTRHDATPNWSENRAPIGGLGSFQLRIEAEAGDAVNADNPIYLVDAKAKCLSNPGATIPVPLWNPDNLHATLPALAFAADGWEYNSAGERYTKTWSIGFPVLAALVAAGGPLGFLNQVGEVYQFFVTLIDTAGVKRVASTAVSEPFILL